MRTALVPVVLLSAVAVLAGCVGPNPYRPVDLTRDLPREVIQRYEAEWQAQSPIGAHHATLEYTNLWPLGLLLYHQRGEVVRVHAPDGVRYMVSTVQGYGPLSFLYATERHATYLADGKRVSGMAVQAVVRGCVVMFHQSDTLRADGAHEQNRSMHALKHLINSHTMDGHSTWSFLTTPGPVAFTSHGGN